MNQRLPVEGMMRVFVFFVVFIIGVVAFFHVLIFQGMPSMMASRSLGEGCDSDNVCYEPLQCRSGQCVLVESEKGGFCSGVDVVCDQGMECWKGVCKQMVGEGKSCDAPSYQVCAKGWYCLDGVCRRI